MVSESEYWEVTFQVNDAEEHSSELFEFGTIGVQIISPNLCNAVFHSRRQDLDLIITEVQARGFQAHQICAVPERNWVQESAELCTPKQIGALRVRPIMSADEAGDPAHNEIVIIPGMGFGTGHHATTSTLIEFLQLPEVTSLRPPKALDVGTGSGILAIAAHKLWGSHVTAIDNDADALRNARENIALNNATPGITLTLSSIEQTSGTYPLVLANIYAEVLAQYASVLRARLAPHGILLLSGILADREPLVTKAFEDCTLILRESRVGWVSLGYKLRR